MFPKLHLPSYLSYVVTVVDLISIIAKNLFFKKKNLIIAMGETKEFYHQDGSVIKQDQWVLMEDKNDDHHHDRDFELVDSDSSECSDESSESESSSSSSSSSSSFGPLYELSELMAQLPIKRGLSKYYQGQSQSFGSLANVKSLEDLAKRGDFSCYNKRMKSSKSKSFGDSQRYGPKPTIAKRTSRAKKESTHSLLGSLIQ